MSLMSEVSSEDSIFLYLNLNFMWYFDYSLEMYLCLVGVFERQLIETGCIRAGISLFKLLCQILEGIECYLNTTKEGCRLDLIILSTFFILKSKVSLWFLQLRQMKAADHTYSLGLE